jgi:hypothetical protein
VDLTSLASLAEPFRVPLREMYRASQEDGVQLAAYAATTVVSPDERDVRIAYGTLGAGACWLNGQKVGEATPSTTPPLRVPPPVGWEAHVSEPVRLHAGPNTLALHLAPDQGAPPWHFIITAVLVDLDGAVATGLRYFSHQGNSVELSTDRAGWQQFARPGFKVRFSYPEVTPQGRVVDRVEDEHEQPHRVRVHLTSRDSRELYFEVIHFPDLTPLEEYTRHRAHLEQRFGAGSTTELSETTLGPWPAWAYAFRWDQGERSVILLQVGRDTYRIIYDPRSPLNTQIISTITVME